MNMNDIFGYNAGAELKKLSEKSSNDVKGWMSKHNLDEGMKNSICKTPWQREREHMTYNIPSSLKRDKETGKMIPYQEWKDKFENKPTRFMINVDHTMPCRYDLLEVTKPGSFSLMGASHEPIDELNIMINGKSYFRLTQGEYANLIKGRFDTNCSTNAYEVYKAAAIRTLDTEEKHTYSNTDKVVELVEKIADQLIKFVEKYGVDPDEAEKMTMHLYNILKELKLTDSLKPSLLKPVDISENLKEDKVMTDHSKMLPSWLLHDPDLKDVDKKRLADNFSFVVEKFPFVTGNRDMLKGMLKEMDLYQSVPADIVYGKKDGSQAKDKDNK